MGLFSRITLLFILITASASLFAQLKGELRQGEFADYAIAVSPVTGGGKEASEITETLERDLNFTGFFNVLNSKGFLEKAETPVKNIDFKNWINIGASGLVKGYMKDSAGKSELELIFFDVAEGKEKLRKKYRASKSAIRPAAHTFVRDLVELLTGKRMAFFSSRIAFVEKSAKRYQLVTVDFDGTNRKVLYSSSKIILLPEWSHDGKTIFFTSYAKGNPHLYSIGVKNRKLHLVAGFPGLNTSPSASPDGKNIALRLSRDGNAELYLLNLRSKKLKRLTRSIAIETAPSFSPDGKEIAFVSNRSGNPHIYRLFVKNPSRVERLTVQGRYNQDPDYSPDGKYIAFTGRDEKYMFDIFLFDIKSRVISRVTQNQGKNENPSFSPEGRLLTFSSDRQGKNSIYISNTKGDKQFLIYSGKGEAVTPSWSPETTESF